MSNKLERPNVLIVDATREGEGTTALFSFLCQHIAVDAPKLNNSI